MADIQDNAYTILRNDFLNIQSENGFENSIKAVYEGQRLPSQMPEKPSVCIEFNIDSQKEELISEQEEIRVLPILIYIFYQATIDTCAEVKKSLRRDFDKMFYRSNLILSDYHSHLKQAGIRTEYHIRAYDPEFTPLTQNQGCVAIRIDLDYYKNSDIVDSYAFSLTSIPTADSRFTLTSVTESLQNRINEISISGANVWGTISGSLSAQTDLQNELNARSLTGHTHLEYFLNSLSSSLTTDLSGYSATSHSHTSLTGLSLYNSTTSNGSLIFDSSVTSSTSPSIRIKGTSPYADSLIYLYSVNGTVSITPGLYSNAFSMQSGQAIQDAGYANKMYMGTYGIRLTPAGTRTTEITNGGLSITGNIITNGLSGVSGTVTAGTTMVFTNGILTSVT